MKGSVNYEWVAEKRMYESIYASRTGRKTKIIDIQGDDLGFTSKDEQIHINPAHKIMEGMVKAEKAAFRSGVFCHEMLHQIFTDFQHLEDVLDEEEDPKKRKVISLLANLVEDPAIEYRAPEVIGGSFLRSLNFTIKVIYEESPEIQ